MGCDIKKKCSGCVCIKKSFDLFNNMEDQDNFGYFQVQFKGNRKEIVINKSEDILNIGDKVVIKYLTGWDLGTVCSRGTNVNKLIDRSKKTKEVINKDTFIQRIATGKDLEKWIESTQKENAVLLKVRDILRKYQLDMKISDVEYQADGQKIFFYYVADDRIDFRELLKEIVSTFKKKIELRQIGQRQEAGKIGGMGSCGSELCCSSWLKDFKSVNIDAVKYQQLSINSEKIIGSCGKLKCCMNYELESYTDKLQDFPTRKILLKTKKGDAQLVKIDILKELTWYAYTNEDDKNLYKIKLEKVNVVIKKNEKGFLLNSLEDISEE